MATTVDEVRSITTITGLKAMARMLKIPGYSKYTAATKEDLRALIIKEIGDGGNEEVIASAKKILSRSAGMFYSKEDLQSLTMNELKELAENAGIPLGDHGKVKARLVGYLLGKKIPKGKKGHEDSGDKDKGKDLHEMTVRELKQLAQNRGIAIPSKSLKDDIINLLEGWGPAKEIIPVKSESGGCLVSRATPLTTAPIMDYQELKLEEVPGNCITHYHINRSKLIGQGTYGKVYSGEWKGQPAVFKLTKIINEKMFKWECVISKRAGQIGIGPEVLHCSMCTKTGNGVIVMAQCKPLPRGPDVQLDLLEINRLINILHQNGIAHRDLARRNIMDSAGKYVFIDYGMALAFSGPVPEEYRVWDHAYLSEDIPQYATLKALASMKKQIDTLLSNMLVLEELTARYLPIEMLKSMGMPLAGTYLNNIPDNASIKEENRLDGILKKRLNDAKTVHYSLKWTPVKEIREVDIGNEKAEKVERKEEAKEPVVITMEEKKEPTLPAVIYSTYDYLYIYGLRVSKSNYSKKIPLSATSINEYIPGLKQSPVKFVHVYYSPDSEYVYVGIPIRLAGLVEWDPVAEMAQRNRVDMYLHIIEDYFDVHPTKYLDFPIPGQRK